jgi:hypothetical protein
MSNFSVFKINTLLASSGPFIFVLFELIFTAAQEETFLPIPLNILFTSGLLTEPQSVL